MLHYILVKWNSDVEKQSAAQAVRVLYAKAAEIAGEALFSWDHSQLHQQWKQKYGAHIEKKCIFDCAGGMEESI